MTQTSRTQPAGRLSHWRSAVRRDQLLACVAGIGLLGVSALLRHALDYRRTAKNESNIQLVREDPESEKKLSSLAVTFPRLTFGGMRGIASTYLWIQAEDDKNDRKWEELETKYDLIGALQPYFASVYVYHSWNQAYNLSAQFQKDDDKYKWVLDGVAYLYKGEDFNPGNPDIIYEEAQLFAMKLGGAGERIFYRRHFRQDQTHLYLLNDVNANKDATIALQHVRDIVNRRDPSDPNSLAAPRGYFHTEELANARGAKGHGIRIYAPTDATGFNLFKDRPAPKPGEVPGAIDYPYGVSPFYFAYIEYTRCMNLPIGPTYTAKRVIDAWPAMSLRLWCRDDLYYISDTMREYFGPDGKVPDNDEFNAKIEELNQCYENIKMIAPRAVDLFDRTLGAYPLTHSIHDKHRMEALADKAIAEGEIRLLNALVSWHNNGSSFEGSRGPQIIQELKDAQDYYNRAIKPTEDWVDKVYPITPGEPANPDRADFERYVNALNEHIRGIDAMLLQPEGKNPDMRFLREEDYVVEK